jgi:DNA modification methylase
VDDEPMIPLLDQVPEITKPKDVWILGNHKVMCGDCRDDQDVNELIKETKINIAITSPPYAEQRKYDEKSGFKPIHPDQYVDWFADVASNVKKHLADDGSWFVNIKPAANNLDTELYVFDLVLSHARKWGWHFGTEYCWERNGVPKNVVNRFRNGFEPIYQFALGKWKMRPKNVRVPSNDVPISLGEGSGNTGWSDKQGKGAIISKNRLRKNKNGSSKTMADQQGMNVGVGEYTVDGLAYPNNRLPTFAGSHEAVGHTAAFPVGLPAWFIRAYTDENDFVYDPFCGSGSTILAANQENRVAYGMEISPRYVDLICARFQIHTGIHPILEATGEAHDFTPDAD